MESQLGARTVRRLALIGCGLLAACAGPTWMMVPASEPLDEVARVGIVDFDGAPAELALRSTREFRQRLLRARPRLEVVRLGVGEDRPDVDVVFLGSIEFHEPSPEELHATLTVRMVAPGPGGMVRWVGAATRSETRKDARAEGDDLRRWMAGELAEDVTDAFRDRVVRRRRRDVPGGNVVTYPDGVEVHVPRAHAHGDTASVRD
ncbi:MAG: hypothetical protein AAGB93_03765 [Planctomycetota bacterium]